jgi:hypothetical protein
MQHHKGQYHYTPSDLVEFFESSFASWMSRLYLEYPQRAIDLRLATAAYRAYSAHDEFV